MKQNRAATITAIAAGLYGANPLDLVPDFLPIIGQSDDLIVILVALVVILLLTGGDDE